MTSISSEHLQALGRQRDFQVGAGQRRHGVRLQLSQQTMAWQRIEFEAQPAAIAEESQLPQLRIEQVVFRSGRIDPDGFRTAEQASARSNIIAAQGEVQFANPHLPILAALERQPVALADEIGDESRQPARGRSVARWQTVRRALG